MAIKNYISLSNNLNVAPNNSGIVGWISAESPGNRMRLIAVDITFNSWNILTNEWDNPFTDRLNYFTAELNMTNRPHPFKNMNRAAGFAPGNAIFFPGFMITMQGHYEYDLQFESQIFMSLYTYNYAAAARGHALNVMFTVDETPLNQ